MKAIMYHYVRAFDEDMPYFRHLNIDDFGKQIEFFGNEFGFISQSDFLESLQSGVTKPGVILTFDDAIRDHYDYVFPELARLGLWGIFYVPTSPYLNNKILDVHRVHLLLGKFGAKKILGLLKKFIDINMLDRSHISDYNQVTYQTQQNDIYRDTVQVKRILNYFISYEFRNELISCLMDAVFEDQSQLLKSFYVSVEELCEMSDAGMMIGSHTESHLVLSKLSPADQRSEIQSSFSFLRDNVPGIRHKTFCYPHGGFHTFTELTEKILTENDVLFSFNVEPRDICTDDLLNRPQALPRYDCNQFPFGSVS